MRGDRDDRLLTLTRSKVSLVQTEKGHLVSFFLVAASVPRLQQAGHFSGIRVELYSTNSDGAGAFLCYSYFPTATRSSASDLGTNLTAESSNKA